MSILPHPPQTDIITAQPAGAALVAALAERLAMSATGQDPEALAMPLAELVQSAMSATGTESTHTARAYLTGVGTFLAWLSDRLDLPTEWQPLALASQQPRPDGRGTPRTIWEFRGEARVLQDITPATLTGWAADLRTDKARATAAQRLQAVKTFLNFAYGEGVFSDAQARRLDLKPYHRRERRDVKPTGRRLDKAEVRALRETVLLAARNETKTARDRALLDCMLFAGLRCAEAATLKTGDVRPEAGRWWLVVTGKGQKTRKIKVHDTLYKSLATWAELAGLALGAGDLPIFCNLTKAGKPTGNPLDSSVIGRLVAEYGNRAGLAPLHGENRLAPHDLRRTCARNAYENGAKLPQIQALLGHSDVKTTMIYIGADDNPDDTAIDYVRY